MFTQIFDISLPLNKDTVIFPGDAPLTIQPVHHAGKPLPRLSRMSLGSHTGTHVDVPSHFIAEGKTLDQISLDHFIGECRVLDLTTCESIITADDLARHTIQAGERILLKTKNSFTDRTRFVDSYVCLDESAGQYLVERKVSLVGIDYLSIEKPAAPGHPVHTALLGSDIPILETILLEQVEPGSYFLVAQPLAFTALDASPVRALLLR